MGRHPTGHRGHAGGMTDSPKTIAFVLYPGCTPLDLVGPLQVLTSMAQISGGYETVVVAADLDQVETDTPLRLAASRTFAQVPAPYAVVVPGGGLPTIQAMTDETLLDYLRTAAGHAELVGSVCTGSLLLGAAGLLEGRRATTHWAFLDVLTGLGAEPVRERWVADGNVLTAAGVSAGIDMALHLSTELVGANLTRHVQFGIEYDPQPPLGPLDWSEAPHAIWTTIRDELLRAGLAGSPLYERLAG